MGRGEIQWFPRRTAILLMISVGAVAHLIPEFAISQAAFERTVARPNRASDSASIRTTTTRGDDGWPDLSSFLDEPYGFVPLLGPITEPAIGYGVWGGPVLIGEPSHRREAGFGRPNITFGAGFWTQNGSWGAMAGDMRHWMDDRLQTLVGAIYASVNLDFYGIGDDPLLRDDPISYNLEAVGGMVQAKYRLGMTPVWVGLGYAFATTHVLFDVQKGDVRVEDITLDTDVGGLLPGLSYDSRDNIFTPACGTYAEVSAGLFSQVLGGDAGFQRVSLIAMQYFSPNPSLTFGIRGDANFSFGDVPFYLRPFISLRGSQAMRYQGEHLAQGELEARWQFWKRLSVVGFVGYGAAWNTLKQIEHSVNVTTGGLGVRYELARKYGLHVGVDVGFGPDDTAIYIQFGSAWMRP